MAARKRRTTLSSEWRERIQTSMLINHLQNHVFGRCEMTSVQVRATLSLLKKTLPDLPPAKVTRDAGPGFADAIRESYKCDMQRVGRKV
jgi:hypothetical protein